VKKGKIYIGTSGWHYKHWKGTFYPAGIKESDQFPEYQKSFQTVEINNSFYRMPSTETFEAWRDAAPKKFVFAVKASRFLTHAKKLIVDKRSIDLLITHAGKLEEKLAVILFQLPPRWKLNVERLREFIGALPKGYRYTFEFREQSWYNDEVYAILKESNCAFCIYELGGHLSPIEVTADFIYIRLHGPGEKYQGSYPDKTLKEWVARCKDWLKKGKDVFVYFDNDQEGYAAFNALRMKELIL
jgi:uncharacterized protein YecE (DUF72 family)